MCSSDLDRTEFLDGGREPLGGGSGVARHERRHAPQGEGEQTEEADAGGHGDDRPGEGGLQARPTHATSVPDADADRRAELSGTPCST
mgnify:FL=1